MAFNINGTTLSSGSTSFTVQGTASGSSTTLLSSNSSGDVSMGQWNVTGRSAPGGTSWNIHDEYYVGGNTPTLMRVSKIFTTGGSAVNYPIFRFTPSDGWTQYFMKMTITNDRYNGLGIGSWLIYCGGGSYSQAIATWQTPTGGYQGSTAPTLGTQTQVGGYPDSGYYDVTLSYNVAAYSGVCVELEFDQNVQSLVSSITGKWQVALL